MKYKVGDRVKVRENLFSGKEYNGVLFTHGMNDFKGKFVTIKEATIDFYGIEYYSVEETGWTFSGDMFEDKDEWKISKDVLRKYDALLKSYIAKPIEYDLNGKSAYEIVKKFTKEWEKNMKVKIVNYEVHDNNGVKTVVVEFGDGTKEHAVCCKEDVFDLKTGIEVCVCKHVFGGNDKYKSAIRNAMNQVKAIDKARADKKAEEELIARKKEKNAKRKARHKANRRARRVAEMRDAYLAAMRKYGENVSVDSFDALL